MNARPADIDAYLSTVPADARATLQQLRRSIKALVPDAVESISYGMPTLKYRGRPLASFAAWQTHCVLYGGGLDAIADELAAYDTSKGTLRFPHDAPLPDALVEKLIKARIADIEAYAAERQRKKSGAAT